MFQNLFHTWASWTRCKRRKKKSPDVVWALCSALVYADVVVTEKSWARLANRSLAARYGTLVLDDVGQLVDVLFAVAAA